MIEPRLISVVGLQDAGKTRLVQTMVAVFRQAGLQVGVLKHDGHADACGSNDWEKENSDTRLHAQAGAAVTAVVGGGASLWHVVADNDVTRATTDPTALIARLVQTGLAAGKPLDVIVVEGFKRSPIAKIAVVRTAAQIAWFKRTPLPNVVAVVVPDTAMLVADSAVQVYHEADTLRLCSDLLAQWRSMDE